MSTALQGYYSQRAQLIAEDTALRADRAKLASLSEAESKAEAIIRKIRKEESETIWAPQNEQLEHPFPGMAFLTAKKTIESTKMFEIIKKMPKGALLHAHLEATVDAETLLKTALDYPNICIRASEVITADNIGTLLPDFKPLPANSTYDASCIITSPDYQPYTYVTAKKVRDQWPQKLGGPRGFDEWVVKSMTINPNEAYNTHNTTVKIWEKFKSCFTVIHGLLTYEPVVKTFIRRLLESCIEDGISYAEFRMNFTPKTIVAKDGIGEFDHSMFLAAFQEELEAFQEALRKENKSNLFQGAKIIYTIIRVMTPQELEWYLEDCLNLKQKYPSVLAGFDIVGPEDTTNPLIYYLEPLLAFRSKCDSLGVDLPFLFHAGETLGDGNSVDQNLYDAILLGTKRIGHAFSLIKHPTLMRLCRERGICCEVCPVSNEILRLTSSMPAHPLAAMLNHGVPIALASDDPGIFSNLGLSYDFFQVVMGSEISGLMTLAVLARDSLKHAMLDEDTKSHAMNAWDARWNQFVQELVTSQGSCL
ncbi:adenosine deaminase-related growth [Serendipita vermifera]|nr:adenosine deaminase-related growth [Serendipita vermifera]